MSDLTRKWQHRDRIIKKRQKIVKEIFTIPKDHMWLSQPGRLYKYNLKCGCQMCKRERTKRLSAGQVKKIIEEGES